MTRPLLTDRLEAAFMLAGFMMIGLLIGVAI